ncbi:hypothetical protein AVEN_55203-1 [Araneus ventricosus]|uniref:Histone-lysine N-methyltransferase SETMAR n=1 Tax=Araneus ventricosus TaxID=182803 RepID=A0A4Y2G6I6_ARAVE|nr:hypothetical protein AVEN_55203-1 [Araneus ventricosus]
MYVHPDAKAGRSDDNAHPHNVAVTQQLLEQFKSDVSDYPAFSPDLATNYFRLFPELKLGGQSFQKNEEIQSNAKAHLTSLAGTFFEEGIVNLVHRYDKCLNLRGCRKVAMFEHNF